MAKHTVVAADIAKVVFDVAALMLLHASPPLRPAAAPAPHAERA